MKTIWKFELPIDNTVEIEMPAFATILSVHVQYGKPCIWAVVDDQERKVKRRFHWRGTGHPFGEMRSVSFVGTIQLEEGALVFHLFVDPE